MIRNAGSVRHLLAHPVLTVAQERELHRLAQAGSTAARDRLVECHGQLVAKIAGQYAGLGVDFDDLWQQGMLGVLDAIPRWDAGRGVRFSTYAWAWIRHHVGRYARANSSDIRTPDHAQGKRRAMARGEEVAPGWAEELAHAGRIVASLDEPAPRGGTFADLLDGHDGDADRLEQALDVAALLDQDCLDDRDRHVLARHYFEGAKRAEIADGLGISPQRVELVRRSAVAALAERLDDIREGRETYAKRDRPGCQLPLPILGPV